MEFIVRQLSSRPDTVLVRYDCPCGCKPGVEYKQQSEEVGHEHCCCGNVHSVGKDSRQHLQAYLDDRKAQGMDEEVGGYTLQDTSVSAPWGETISVSYALPKMPKKH